MATSLEPATTARVILETSKGPLEFELWAKETPLASRNFLQRCAEGYYDGKTFHRIAKGFVAQAGSGYRDNSTDAFFADEIHTRLKFTSRPRGILGTANMSGKKNSNGSQFIITLGNGPQTQALNGKSTVFGKIVGDSIYNLAKIELDSEMLEDGETPMYPTVIKSAKILESYFDDLVYKSATKDATEEAKPVFKKRAKKAKVRVSYDDDEDAEEDEGIQLNKPAKKRFKMKSAHETMNDKSLALESKETKAPGAKVEKPAPRPVAKPAPAAPEVESQPPIQSEAPAKEEQAAHPKTAAELDSEYERLKASLKNQTEPAKIEPIKSKLSVVEQEREAYLSKQNLPRRKDASKRESQTLSLLNKFTSKLASSASSAPSTAKSSTPTPTIKAQAPHEDNEDDDLDSLDGSDDDDDDGTSIWSHRFLPEHVESKDDSLITQFTDTKHNDNKYGQEDPEFLLRKKSEADALLSKASIGKRSGALASTQKLREELRQRKLKQIANQED